jgi:hypothetical protein
MFGRRKPKQLMLRLVAGGSVAGAPQHTVDRAPVSWLMLAASLIGLITVAAIAIFVL